MSIYRKVVLGITPSTTFVHNLKAFVNRSLQMPLLTLYCEMLSRNLSSQLFKLILHCLAYVLGCGISCDHFLNTEHISSDTPSGHALFKLSIFWNSL